MNPLSLSDLGISHQTDTNPSNGQQGLKIKGPANTLHTNARGETGPPHGGSQSPGPLQGAPERKPGRLVLPYFLRREAAWWDVPHETLRVGGTKSGPASASAPVVALGKPLAHFKSKGAS